MENGSTKARQLRFYKSDLACGCKTCRDIFSYTQCINTKPCPNSKDRNSFCYWRFGPIFTIGPPTLIAPLSKRSSDAEDIAISPIPVPFLHGSCQCCTPVPCKRPKVFRNATCRCECPIPPPRCLPGQSYNPNTCQCECPPPNCKPGQTYNTHTCQCECPKGSDLDENGNCTGDCEDVSLNSCSFVGCRDNPHFRCKSDGYRCRCPTCESASSHQCSITKCLEQPRPMKPRCKLDAKTHKCRCPTCEDQMDKLWCDMTHCTVDYRQLQCKWNIYDGSCSCPH